VTRECLLEQRGPSHIQISLGITSSGLDKRSGTSAVCGNYNLIPDVVSQYILVFGKDINSLDVKVQEIGRPRGGASIYESAFSSRNLRQSVRHPPMDPLTGNERSSLDAVTP